MKAATALIVICTAALLSVADGRAEPPHWVAQTSGVSSRLRGVSAASEQVVWASGANGTIIRTADGGENWRRLTIPDTENLDFRDIDAIDERTAFALSIGAGAASRIYKTTDSGADWTLQFTNGDPNAFYDAMAFWDANHGLAISDSVDGKFVILSTRDGGAHWTRVPAGVLPPALPNEGAFAGSGTNIAVLGRDMAWIGTGASTRSRVLRTSDGGYTWMIADTPVKTSKSAGIFSVAFRDPMHGLVAGGDYRKETDSTNVAAASSDGGDSWTLVTGLGGFRSVVAYRPGSAASWIAVGPAGSDVTTNDGKTWTALTGDGYHAFSFAPRGGVGWGAGESGRIGKLIW